MKTPVTEWKEGSERLALVVGDLGKQGPKPAILWAHSAVGSSEVFLEEASALAGLGAVSLLVEAPYSKARLGERRRGSQNPDLEYALWGQSAAEWTSLLDRLVGTTEIELVRSKAVGQNLGGSHVAHWLTKDRRIRSGLATGSVPELSLGWPADLRERMRPFDLTESLSQMPDHRYYFQFGHRDDWIDPRSVDRLAQRISGHQKIEWFDDGHEMMSPLAVESRLRWLLGEPVFRSRPSALGPQSQ